MNIRVKYLNNEPINTIQIIELEEFIKGVVPSEIGWNYAEDTLKSQAIAVRTFSMSKILRHTNKDYDVTDTYKHDMAYHPEKRHDKTDKAVDDTYGKVLIWELEILRSCLFSACNGGLTKLPSKHWIGSRDYPYTIVKEDPYTIRYMKRTGDTERGHGIGLSQVGARQMGLEGFSYKEILDFYYPSTRVVNNYNNEEGEDVLNIADEIHVKYMIKNRCYIKGQYIDVKGIMVHSTGCPATPASQWYDRWNYSQPDGKGKCVHAFLDNTEIWQYLPWDMRGWHAGGSANNTHIGFEICEPQGADRLTNAEYFTKTYNNTIDFCVYLCKLFGLNETNIICHSEGNSLGTASNHSDVMHWFPLHGKSMDTLRSDIKIVLNNGGTEKLIVKSYRVLNKYKSNLSLRATPGGKIIGRINNNTIIKYENEKVTLLFAVWIKISYQNQSGWMNGKYLMIEEQIADVSETPIAPEVISPDYDDYILKSNIKPMLDNIQIELDEINKLM